jgi:hypothetical protein
MKKETAVEWLSKQIKGGKWRFGDITDREAIIKKAFEMEKEQIIEAHGDKQKTKSNPDSIVTYGYTYTGKDYYNDKYEKL